MALAAVQDADATRYPDAAYTALRAALADFHGVAPGRIVLAGSASEFIFRISAWVARQGGRSVHVPRHAYGDYLHGAQAWGLERVGDQDAADLVWACEPSSPLGQAHGNWPRRLGQVGAPTVVLDCAYAPLRLQGAPSLDTAQRDGVWQLYSPNKALGLTGVRAAYALAPVYAQDAAAQLDALAPSWVVGAHGEAMLQAWTQPATQQWLAQSLVLLRQWKERQLVLLQAQGWECQPSDANFFCARPPAPLDLAALRAAGIKLRDATSFGLSGWYRLGTLAPEAQDALRTALEAQRGDNTHPSVPV
ncbi:MAG: aminotransferase class I/II-fold pyridoxal phosphate-dependent enzyme [Rhodoferax sp.]|nr:MAG: aminotransferase class I/II-fold pyridoxal phosphate-dependent enzyme [Rhodoferax sp.]